MITRVTNDLNQTQTAVNMVLRLFLRSPFIVFGAMIMAFTIDVKGALVFVVTIPVLAVIVYGIMLVTMPMYKRVQKSLEKVLCLTRENLSGARVVRAFNQENSEIDEYAKSSRDLMRQQIRVGKIQAFLY